MKTKSTTKQMKASEAFAVSRGAVELLAAVAGEDAKISGSKFKMTLYTGERISTWGGDVILDVSGFSPKRTSDIPAMAEHYDRVGTIDSVSASGANIFASGRLLDNNPELFPELAKIRAILASGHPMQCSGRWVPMSIEEIPAGEQTKVNGQVVNGPVDIWRKFSIREGSFCDLGRDQMTDAELAASGKRDDGAITVQVSTQEKSNMANMNLLASLKDIVGADKAFELLAANPEAADLGAFSKDIAASFRKINDDLKASEAKVSDLTAKLATATAAPPVITTPATATPPVIPLPGVTASDTRPDSELNASELEVRAKADYDGSKDLKAQFPEFGQYFSLRKRGITPESVNSKKAGFARLGVMLMVAVLALFACMGIAFATQSDTNSTTTATAYTPKFPGEILLGNTGSTSTVWVASGQTSNNWTKVSN